jgi:hypothetical protein
MNNLTVEKFMAQETMTQWTIVTKDGEYVRKCGVDDFPLGVLRHDCIMGDLVEIVLYGVI